MTALTMIMVATPSMTLTTDARAMNRDNRYRQQRRSLYMSGMVTKLSVSDNVKKPIL
jgi:hypothetical protein